MGYKKLYLRIYLGKGPKRKVANKLKLSKNVSSGVAVLSCREKKLK